MCGSFAKADSFKDGHSGDSCPRNYYRSGSRCIEYKPRERVSGGEQWYSHAKHMPYRKDLPPEGEVWLRKSSKRVKCPFWAEDEGLYCVQRGR